MGVPDMKYDDTNWPVIIIIVAVFLYFYFTGDPVSPEDWYTGY